MAREKKEEKSKAKKPAAAKAVVKKKAEKKPTVKKTVEQVKALKVSPAKIEKAPKNKISEPAKEAKPRKKLKVVDTGSVDFQIHNFSAKIASLAKHLKTHPHDFDSRRGLLIMVGKRRRLLNYVKKSEPEKYEPLAKSLKLKQ